MRVRATYQCLLEEAALLVVYGRPFSHHRRCPDADALLLTRWLYQPLTWTTRALRGQ